MDGDQVFGFPDVVQKIVVCDLIDSTFAVEEHIASIDSSSGATLHQYVLSFVKILTLFFSNGHVHLLRFLGLLLGALPC